MKIKLVTDSSANLMHMKGVEFDSAPLKVIVGSREFEDNDGADVGQLLQALKQHKGPSSTACPSVQDWLEAFGDADIVYGAAITSNLSGCFGAAQIAAEEYMQTYPGRKVFILDSLSTGPELELIMEKYRELILEGKKFEQVCQQIQIYAGTTQLMFCLESLSNFAKNGRVSPVVAAAVGILGVRIIGKASEQGTLQPLHKVRGEKKTLRQLLSGMQVEGYRGGKVRIAHTLNIQGAQALAEAIRAEYPNSDISIRENRVLCSYYAEIGGILVGFET